MTPSVVVSLRAEQRLRNRHPWIYRTDVNDIHAEPGDLVRVRSGHGRTLGWALYSSRSQIALRMLSYSEETADATLLEQRIASALEFRRGLDIADSAYRIVHGEADRLPSLVVDRYGDYLVVQALSQAMDRLLPVVVDVLQKELQPKGILARNDARTRLLEGLERRVDVVAGDVPASVAATQNGLQFLVDLWHGQKTGLFLDQRENRQAARRYAHGRLLDCFSYQGGFALTLAGVCSEAIALDVSEDAIAMMRTNAARNGIAIDARVGNVFDELRGFERLGQRFDTIVLDPPAFAKTKAARPKAAAGYKEINLRALKLLNANGTLVTCSCSYHISESDLLDIVHAAAVDAQTQVTLVEKRMQSRDHPVLVGVPETHYLKCLILRKLG
jgi:23S rRNA (cytosine1962-C5)-methyltransferase